MDITPPDWQATETSCQLLRYRPPGVPFTRAASVSNFITYLNRIGLPTERYLRQARILLTLFADPETPVPVHLCGRFAELVTRKEGIDELGLFVAQHTSLLSLGRYGQVLSQSLTVFVYLNTGITSLNRFTSGEHLRLEAHENNLRLYHAAPRGAIEASNHSQLFTLMFTISILGSVTGNAWSPGELYIPGYTAGN